MSDIYLHLRKNTAEISGKKSYTLLDVIVHSLWICKQEGR